MDTANGVGLALPARLVTRRSRAFVAICCLLAACGTLLAPIPAAAGILTAPDFPISPLHLETAGAQSAMYYQYSAYATSIDARDGANTGKAYILPTSGQERVQEGTSATAVATRIPSAVLEGSNAHSLITFDQSLKSIHAYAVVDVTKTGSANANALLWSMDLITITKAGQFDINLMASGTASKATWPPESSSQSFAGGSATADIYFWEYGVGGLNSNPPRAGDAFFFNYHATWSITPDGGSILKSDGPLLGDLAEGSRWWIATRLVIFANGQATLSSYTPLTLTGFADLSHTLEIHFDPDPLTPDASYITASGADYRTLLEPPPPPPNPAPEPGTLALLGLGLAGLAATRKRKQ